MGSGHALNISPDVPHNISPDFPVGYFPFQFASLAADCHSPWAACVYLQCGGGCFWWEVDCVWCLSVPRAFHNHRSVYSLCVVTVFGWLCTCVCVFTLTACARRVSIKWHVIRWHGTYHSVWYYIIIVIIINSSTRYSAETKRKVKNYSTHKYNTKYNKMHN